MFHNIVSYLILFYLAPLVLVEAVLQRWNESVFPSATFGHVAATLQLPSLPANLLQHGLADPANAAATGASGSFMMVHGGWPWDLTLPVGTTYWLDAATWRWFPFAIPGDSPTRRHYHTAVSSPEGDFALVYAGFQTVPLGDLYLLLVDPATPAPRWFRIQATCEDQVDPQAAASSCAPAARSGHTSVLRSISDTEYEMVVFGGVGSSGPRNDVQVLSVTRGTGAAMETWTFQWKSQASLAASSVANAPSPRMGHASAIWDNEMFV